MKFISKKGRVRKCCLTCNNFAYWDGDYACVTKFLLLQNGICGKIGGYHDPAWITSQLEKNMKFANECKDYEDSGHPFTEDYIEEFKKYRELQKKVEELEKFVK